MNNRKPKISHKPALVKKLLIVDGIGRSGKFLLANLINGLKGIEPVQCRSCLEQVPVLEKFGFIKTEAAREILRCEIDTYCYEMLIGRNLNYRTSDKSSIFNLPNYQQYLSRCNKPDGEAPIKNFWKKDSYSFFIAHELMPNIGIYFDIFSEIKVVSIARSPVDLVYSWKTRGILKRIGKDERMFQIPFTDKKGLPVPWYIAFLDKQFNSLPEMDKIIVAIENLLQMYKSGYVALPARNKQKICLIRYEDIILRPWDVVEAIGKFLKKPLQKKQLKTILEREHLPNSAYFEAKKEKIAVIKKLASAKTFKRLMELEAAYFSHK